MNTSPGKVLFFRCSGAIETVSSGMSAPSASPDSKRRKASRRSSSVGSRRAIGQHLRPAVHSWSARMGGRPGSDRGDEFSARAAMTPVEGATRRLGQQEPEGHQIRQSPMISVHLGEFTTEAKVPARISSERTSKTGCLLSGGPTISGSSMATI